jgi:2,4-dienoyl-CoA reductase-like NADH-dependent reductase (Old Yellow Enzyme family)
MAAGGVELDDTIKMVTLLKDRGVDLWHVSSGGIVPMEMHTGQSGYQVPYS